MPNQARFTEFSGTSTPSQCLFQGKLFWWLAPKANLSRQENNYMDQSLCPFPSALIGFLKNLLNYEYLFWSHLKSISELRRVGFQLFQSQEAWSIRYWTCRKEATGWGCSLGLQATWANYSFCFLFFFLAVLSLRCCAWAFSSCGERGLLFVAVRGLLIGVPSLAVEHGL